MKKWQQKVIVQKTISYLPFSHKINYLFQKYVTKGVQLSDEYFYDRLGHARDHISSYQHYSSRPVPASSLEIGTGWYPIVPISLFLLGVEKIYSVDISFLTSKPRLLTTLQQFAACAKAGRLREFVDFQEVRLAELHGLLAQYEQLSLEQILAKLHIIYLIEDARHLSLADNSIDLVNSNNTFEHIYLELLKPILLDFKRVVNKQHGVMSHFIDMSDHFAHFDKSISTYNFLQFSPRQWGWIDNDIQPQSRARIYDYRRLYAELSIPITAESYRPGSVEELSKVRLDAGYAAYPAEEVAKTHCHFVSAMHNAV